MERIKEKLKSNEALLVSKPANIFYLTGFRGASETERESLVLVTSQKIYLITTLMYGNWKPQNTQFELVVMQHKGFSDTLMDVIPGNIDTLKFDVTDLKYIEFKGLSEKFKKKNPLFKLEESEGIIEAAREVKTDEEIMNIKKAQRLTGETLKHALDLLENGGYKIYTEISFAEKIRQISFELGGEGLGFDTIVASGEGSAEPHYRPSNKPLKPDACLLIDLGVKYKGYTGDLTRTFYLGEPTAEFQEDYKLVDKCKNKVIDLIRSSVSIRSLQNAAESFFEQHTVNEYFIHSIGHGVGLEIHEAPSGSRNKEVLLQAGNVFTVEPGLYFYEEYGIRLEDMVLVTSDGCEILQSFPSKSYSIHI